MKKIIITGHTKGLGLAIYNYFTNLVGYNVIGLSRSNGFDIEHDIEKVIEFIKDERPDYFFNNVYCHATQSTMIERLSEDTVVITSGSMAADASEPSRQINPYYRNKHTVEQTHRRIKKNNKLPMLLLKMGYLENYPDKEPVMYSEILNGIDFWINNNTRVSMIEWDNINYDKNFKRN
jgi:hypothetical protein